MITLAEARDRARRRYDRHHVTWALATARGRLITDVPLDLPLHPPSERAALADQAAAMEWVASWREVAGVRWEPRRWASLGTQDVPVRLVLTDPTSVADLAGRTSHWRAVTTRFRSIVAEWDGAELLDGALRSHASAITALPEDDFARLLAVLRWLVANPDSGVYIRQLPIRGVDTKWTQRHRGLVTGLHRAITGRQHLGLAAAPVLLRMRFLDRSLAPGGLGDLSAPVGELAALDITPEVVLVVENLETLVALPTHLDAVVVHGAGHAVDRLAGIPWLDRAELRYWGDLDSHGFAILDRFRGYYPGVRSVLMDRATLLAHRDLWVPDPKPTRTTPTRLTAEETATLALLREEGDVRLEQERLDLEVCVRALEEHVG